MTTGEAEALRRTIEDWCNDLKAAQAAPAGDRARILQDLLDTMRNHQRHVGLLAKKAAR